MIGSNPAMLAGLLLLAPACAQEDPPGTVQAKPQASDFVRFIDQGEHRGRLEVAIVRYRDASGVEVDLVSAVHIGDPAYYRGLGARFAGYDAVLYELVAPEGTRPQRDQRGGDSIVSWLQRGMKQLLDLEFQLEGIDYQQPNFVHADLSPAEIARRWEERGDSMWKLILRMLAASMKAQQDQTDDGESTAALVIALFAKDRSQRLKHLFAQQLERIETLLATFGGGENAGESVLVGARNARAIEVLQRQVAAGKKRLAIFYGAAHMPDMEVRLQRLGYALAGTEWLTAWNVAAGETAPTSADRDR